MDYKKKVIDILKYDVNLMENENRTEVNITNVEEVAEQIVKLFAIPDVSGSLHIDFAVYLTGHDKETIEQMYNDWRQ